jgi:hypothetical protein
MSQTQDDWQEAVHAFLALLPHLPDDALDALRAACVSILAERETRSPREPITSV